MEEVPKLHLIPVVPTDDWYARRVGVAAAREINEIPAGRPLEQESKVRPAGMTPFLTLAKQHGCTIQTGPEMTETQLVALAAFMGVAA